MDKTIIKNTHAGIIIYDSALNPVFYNQLVDQLVSAASGISLNDEGLLIFSDADFSLKFSSAMAQALRLSLMQRQMPDKVLRYEEGECCLTVVVSALNASKISGRAGGVMISLCQAQFQPQLDVETLRSCFKLTPTEAEIARRLARGEAVNDIASTMHRSKETVRTHLRKVFAKTKTERQGELISLMASLSYQHA